MTHPPALCIEHDGLICPKSCPNCGILEAVARLNGNGNTSAQERILIYDRVAKPSGVRTDLNALLNNCTRVVTQNETIFSDA